MPLQRRRLLALATLTLTGCGGGGSSETSSASATTAPGAPVGAASAATPATGATATGPTAAYRVHFRNHWSEAAFPTRFPAGAHLTGIVGGTHATGFDFWAVGRPATLGIKNMAELGSKAALLDEVALAVAAGQAEFALSGGGVALGVAEVQLDFTVSQRFPRVTLVSMLGPSPDWFTGVAGVLLLRDGAWVTSLEMPMRVYDAGTDDGTDFIAPDLVTTPPGVVLPLGTAPQQSDLQDGVHRGSGAALASIMFERLG